MSQPKGEIREQLDDLRDELRKMADEIRLKVHLASLDAKDTWNREIEPKLHDFEQRAERATEKVGHELSDTARELRGRMRKLRDELRAH